MLKTNAVKMMICRYSTCLIAFPERSLVILCCLGHSLVISVNQEFFKHVGNISGQARTVLMGLEGFTLSQTLLGAFFVILTAVL